MLFALSAIKNSCFDRGALGQWARRSSSLRQLFGTALVLLMVAATIGTKAAAQVSFDGPDLLPPEQAFALRAEVVEQRMKVSFAIEDGYYLYRDKIHLRTVGKEARLGTPQLPPGIVIQDEFFGDVATYRGLLEFAVPLLASGPSPMLVEVVSQGCADIGVCYPPTVATLAFAAADGPGRLVAAGASELVNGQAQEELPMDESQAAIVTLRDESLIVILAIFFGYGLLLSFTPCVLPMVPIVLGVVCRGTALGSRRAFVLTLSYVLGMATVYTALGVVTAQTGLLLVGVLQQPWLLVTLALFFIALGASVFGLFKMRLMPARVADALARLSARAGGTHWGATAMGMTSAVVVSPCVAAPLAGAILFIAQSGNVVIGGSALLAMALGMGCLLLATAAGAGALLPRASVYSKVVRQLFGLLLFALAGWITASLLPVWLSLWFYSGLSLVAAWLLGWTAVTSFRGLSNKTRLLPGLLALGLAAVFVGGALVMGAGALTGARSVFAPLAQFSAPATAELSFRKVSSQAELAQALTGDERVAMLEYYADWCVSCQEMEVYTFGDKRVRARLGQANLIQVDVGMVDVAGRELLAQYGLIGPPAVIFLAPDGKMLARVVGYQGADMFLKILDEIAIN